MESTTGVRESTKRATREALVDAALHEFSVHGFDGPSLDAICARAGYTRGAFYVHFRNRDELIAAAMEQSLHAFLDEVIVDGGGQGDIDATVRRFLEIGLTPQPETGRVVGPPMRQLLDACHRSNDVRLRFLQVLDEARDRLSVGIEAGQAAQTVRADTQAEDLAGLLVVLAIGGRAAEEFGMALDLKYVRDVLLRLLGSGG